jgi:ATP-dependent exoDNAse (exonuclease V) alpha subunit
MSNHLSFEQEQIKTIFLQGKSLFITGAGGTGKTHLIRDLINSTYLKEPDSVVTAMTGCASILIHDNAKTLASWSGIGIANTEDEKIIERIRKNKVYRKNWSRVQVLFVDEVSMMSKRTFELLDKIARKIRKCDIMFGGIQMIFCGDFFQLPPIPDEFDKGIHCFKSPLWKELFGENQFELTTNFRQEDEEYSKILNDIRYGKISGKTKKQLESRINVKPPPDLNCVELYATRYRVDVINEKFNDQIESTCQVFNPLLIDENGFPVNSEKYKSVIRCNSNATFRDKSLILKVGSQVMCTVNIDMHSKKQKIVNGSTGVVVKFSPDGFPVVKFTNGRVLTFLPHTIDFEAFGKTYSFKTMPLILSWAISIHKSQGATLDNAIIDCGNSIFEAGQIYVALSRIKSLKGLYLKGFDFSKIIIKKSVLEFYHSLKSRCIHA